MFTGQKEILRLNFILDKLSRADTGASFQLHSWLERGVPPEDADRLLIVLDVLEEEIGKIKNQCDEVLKLIKALQSQ
jgi:hypothetical protein